MLNLDLSTAFGRRVLERLQTEFVIWLTTVSKDGTPHPKPVWFLWDGEAVLVYSQPSAFCLKHIARSPRVSLNFDSEKGPAAAISFTGSASFEERTGAPRDDAFLAKYADRLPALLAEYGENFASLYTVLIRILPDRVAAN